jgi:hypothetical protein
MYSQTAIFMAVFAITTAAPVVTQIDSNRLSNAIPKSNEETIATSSNKERNWLLTKAWLIDNINRLRHEFNELERDYSNHVETSNTLNSNKDKQLVQDIATLRADHTVLSQQQKQIIQLIKKNQILNNGNHESKEETKVTETTTNSNLLKKKHKKRHSNFKHFQQKEQLFEDQTKRNMTEVFAEMSALHDITLTLFEDLISLEKRISDKSEQ